MIAQQPIFDQCSNEEASRRVPELTACVTGIDVVIAWMIALAAICSLALLLWRF